MARVRFCLREARGADRAARCPQSLSRYHCTVETYRRERAIVQYHLAKPGCESGRCLVKVDGKWLIVPGLIIPYRYLTIDEVNCSGVVNICSQRQIIVMKILGNPDIY